MTSSTFILKESLHCYNITPFSKHCQKSVTDPAVCNAVYIQVKLHFPSICNPHIERGILDTAESDLDDHVSGLGQVHGDVAPREVAVADADVTNLGIQLTSLGKTLLIKDTQKTYLDDKT